MSWKEISSYLDTAVRTCQRWEKKLNLPIHRISESGKSRVFAYREEIDNWLRSKLPISGYKNKISLYKLNTIKNIIIAILLIIIGIMLFFIIF